MVGKIPLVSEAEAANPRAIDNFMPTRHAEMVGITVERRRHTFALRVSGDSMASLERDSFPEGAVVVVEPEMEPIAGDFVIARDGDGAVLFKQLVAHDDGIWLKPLNRRYPSRPLGSHQVIGVVRETVKSFR